MVDCPLGLKTGEAACFMLWPVTAPIPEGWTDEGIVPAHHQEYSRMIRETKTADPKAGG